MSVMTANALSSTTKTSAATVISQETADWVKLFPRQVTQTYTSSVAFMKQLTTIAVSMITYLKEIFPEESYCTETFADVDLKILKTKCEDENAHFISSSLIKSFEALEKKYLSKLVLCLYDGSCRVEDLVEAYSFEFTYSLSGVSMDVHSFGRATQSNNGAPIAARDCGAAKRTSKYTFENIRTCTLDLLDACFAMSQHDRVTTYDATKQDITLRLYYNDEAPAGYQAPGFSPLNPEQVLEEDPLTPALAEARLLGSVETPFHHLAASCYIRNIPSSHTANASPNNPVMTQDEYIHESIDEQQVPPFHTGSRGTEAKKAPELAVRCLCSSYGGNEESPLITCYYCGTLQHATCYGVRCSAAAALTRHCCTRCYDLEQARAPTCLRLATLSSRRHRESLCLLRRVLVWVTSAREATASALATHFQLEDSVAHKLIVRLQSWGVLHGSREHLDSPQKIDDDVLKNVLNEYFQSDGNTLADQLVAESMSNDRTSDPVGDMLGPIEQNALQNATTICRIIEHRRSNPAVEDSTLKQYKQAIFSTDMNTENELPLSGSHNPVKNITKLEENKVIKRKMNDSVKKPVKSRLSTKKSKLKP